jgi:serine protease AprX
MQHSVLLLLLASGLSAAEGPGGKLDPALVDLSSSTQSIDVIVQYRHIPTEADHNRAAARGGELRHSLGIIRAAHYAIPANQLQALADDPNVEFIAPDRAVKGLATNSYIGSPDYGWHTVGADLATSVYGLNGAGVGIALLDSGINNDPDLNGTIGSRIVYSTSLIPNSDPNDHYGHGTHVSGILAGNGQQSTGGKSTYEIRGIAPRANLVSIKVLGDTGTGTDSTVIAGIELAIQLKTKYNIRVMNLSVGRPITTSYQLDPLCQAVQQAWQAGIVVVVAAGNDGRDNSFGNNGYGTITAPGNSPYAITVGAMNTMGTATPADDKITSYTSKGPTLIDHIVKPDLVAPGNRVFSLNAGGSYFDKTYPTNGVAQQDYTSSSSKGGNQYFVLSGTSMATPMVAGAAALMIQQNPALTPDQIKARLMKTATKFAPGFSMATDPTTGITYTDEYDIFTIGAGYLNIPAALQSSDSFSGAALSPTATYHGLTQTIGLEATSGWGSSATWGSSAVWGTSEGWGLSAVWGSSVFVNGTSVWGSSTSWGLSAVWGSSAIWGSSAVWGTGGKVGSEATTVAILGDN